MGLIFLEKTIQLLYFLPTIVMKFLRSKSFLRKISKLSPMEQLELFHIIIKSENSELFIEENISPNVLVIVYQYIKPYIAHREHISHVRRSVCGLKKEQKNITIVDDLDNNCDKKFPPCPWADDVFPEPDLTIL